MLELTGNTYVVTGGAGFIGSHIVEELVRQNKRVHIIDNLVNGSHDNLECCIDNDLCSFHEQDVAYMDIYTKLFAEADAIFHNAASKCLVCRDDPVLDLNSNALGTLNMANAALLHNIPLIYGSTGSVLNGKPTTYYGASKYCGENYLRAHKIYYPAFKYTTIRYHHVYGPRQDYGPNGGVIAIFIHKMLNNEPIEIHGHGQQRRNFTYVKDVVGANFEVLERELFGWTFNFLNHKQASINEIANVISKMLGKFPVKTTKGAMRLGDTFEVKATNNLEFRFTSLNKGLQETIAWFQEATGNGWLRLPGRKVSVQI